MRYNEFYKDSNSLISENARKVGFLIIMENTTKNASKGMYRELAPSQVSGRNVNWCFFLTLYI